MKEIYESASIVYRQASGEPFAEVVLRGHEDWDFQTEAMANLFECRFMVDVKVVGELIETLGKLKKQLESMELPEPLSEGDALEGGKNA